MALLVLQGEEEAFWCLVAIVETIMPQDYYTGDLLASQVGPHLRSCSPAPAASPDLPTRSQADQRVLKDFLAEKLPRVWSHCANLGVDVSLVTFNWFLVVFVESLPSHILLPLWDAFLHEGSKVSAAAAGLRRVSRAADPWVRSGDLQVRPGPVQVQRGPHPEDPQQPGALPVPALFHQDRHRHQVGSARPPRPLRRPERRLSCRKLGSVAFVDMNPFPGRLLRSRRALHLQRLQGELQRQETETTTSSEGTRTLDAHLTGFTANSESA